MWTQKLEKTYDNNIDLWWNDVENPMAPICHIIKTAQIEIEINHNGDFISARELGKNINTIIPVTEFSAGRTSESSPHALCDMLPYVAGDYATYCKTEKEQEIAKKKNQKYVKALGEWINSKYTHSKAQAIYKYVTKNTIVYDCFQSGIVKLTDDLFFEKAKKVSSQPYEKAVVRFKIKNENGTSEGTWEDKSLINNYIKYYLNRPNQTKGLCYVSAEKQPMALIHPKGILSAAYGAKLVSANDTSGFTYRGRFETSEQVLGLGYESSQKIHSALAWIAKKYGTYIGSSDKRMLMVWNPNGKNVPNIYNLKIDETDERQENITEENYRKKLWKTLNGFREKFDESDDIVIMGLEAATTGRLSITYYKELTAHEFFQNLTDWQYNFRWHFLRFDDKKNPYYNIECPNFYNIVKCALGREKGNILDIDDKLLKEHVQILTKCMLEKQTLPYYIVANLFSRASTPLAYSDNNRDYILSVACAAISKYYNDHGVAHYLYLNTQERDRSYLYGRLLAIYEEIENVGKVNESNITNVLRLQSMYVNRPLYVLSILDQKAQTYLARCKPVTRKFFKKSIGELIDKLYYQNEKLECSLKETYLLGYFLQKQAFKDGECIYF